ncbi:22035_t:CDS:2, partial [Gigaspora rosea]
NRLLFENILSEELYRDIGEYYLDPSVPPKGIVQRPKKLPVIDKIVKKKRFENRSYIDIAKTNEYLLKEENYYDVIIRTDEKQNLKEFHAHSLILNIRSSYFNHALTSNQINKEGKYLIFQFSNIPANIFETILRYLYTATITFYGLKGVEALQLLIAANELHLEDIIGYLISFIRQEFEEFMKQDAISIMQIIFQQDACRLFQENCLHYICTYPETLFEHQNFIQIDQSLLIQILKCDYLEDMKTWKNADYVMLEKTIHECIPLIRWFQISGKEFKQNLALFRNTLSSELYQNIWNYHLDSSSLPHEITILPPRHKRKIASKNDSFYGFHDNPYDFNLIYCSKRDGLYNFHKLCDDKGPTVTIAKLKINELDTCLFGGYNDLNWKNYRDKLPYEKISYSRLNRNFLFSFDNEEDFSTSKFARVKKGKIAVGYDSKAGPFFGSSKYNYKITNSSELFINGKRNIFGYGNNYPDFKKIVKLRNVNNCMVEDYEVWKVTKR